MSSRAAMLFVLLAASFMTAADNSIVNVAVPAIRANLNASGAELQLAVSVYFVTFALLLITGARLGDILGYRRVFLSGLALFGAASLACGLAPDATWLILARAVQGIGAAVMVPQVLTALQLEFEGDARTLAVGLYGVALAGGAAAGQALSGALVSADLFGTSWRPIFLVNLPVGIAALVAGLRYLPERPGTKAARLDLPGVLTLGIAIVLLLVPLMVGREAGWPIWTWASLAASIPAFGVFLALELRTTRAGGYPLLKLEVIREPVIAIGLLAQTFVTVTASGLLFTLGLYLQDGLGKSAFYSGLTLLVWVFAFGAAGPLLRWLPDRVRRVASPLGFAILGVVYLSIAATGLLGPPEGLLLAGMLGLGGLGIGWGFTGLVDHLAGYVPPAHAADLSGLIGTNSELFGAVGVATAGTLYLAIAPGRGLETAMPAFTAVLVAFGILAFLAAAAAARSLALASASVAKATPGSGANGISA